MKLKRQVAGWLKGLPNNLRAAAKRLYQMEEISRRVARTGDPLPLDRTELVGYGRISIVALAGYTGDFQATIFSLIADEIFSARVSNDLKLPVLFLLEEAHTFAPARAATPAEQRAITTTKQIAQEGRKFGVGLILVSQRPSRLDETTLSQCNSYVIMRMVNPSDQNFVRRVIETIGEDEAKILPDLDVGEAVLSGQMINFPVLVKIKEPLSKGEREERDAFEALDEAYAGIKESSRI
ncbi:MAG: ATP-binding protein [Blastocatellia bacterium]|nr:ATP-binding protein [Blastocatellia bacterium]